MGFRPDKKNTLSVQTLENQSETGLISIIDRRRPVSVATSLFCHMTTKQQLQLHHTWTKPLALSALAGLQLVEFT